jgi:co-chaperonin GroES (HSP10)
MVAPIAKPFVPKKVSFQPFNDTVLLQPIPRGMTEGGVVLPENADMGPQKAYVVAVGPGWPTEDGAGRIPMDVAVGDTVYLTLTSAPHKIKLAEGEFLITRMRDMIGKVK